MKRFILPCLCLLALASVTTSYAAKSVFERSKPHCNVGTLGPTSQGRTVVTAALAAAAGASLEPIVVNFDSGAGSSLTGLEALLAKVETDVLQYSIYDFDDIGTVDNMVHGAVVQDGAILVVSAADGPMPQTYEHVLLAGQVGVPAVVVCLNVDGVTDPLQIDRTEKQVRDMLSKAGFDGDQAPVVPASPSLALRGDARALLALANLMNALDATLARVP